MPQLPMHERLHAHSEQDVATSRRTWYHVGRAGRMLLGVGALVLLLFGALAWWVHVSPVLPLDVTITRALQHLSFPWLPAVMDVVSYPGSTFLLWLLIGLAALLFWLFGWRLEAVCLVTLSLVSKGLNVLIKLLVARPRPTPRLVEVLQAATGQSFPSEHVMSYLAFWGLLFCFGLLLFRGTHWWRILWLVVCAAFVPLVGLARVYLGDHWASDVLGAYLIGAVLLGVTLWLYLTLKKRGVLQTRSMRQ